MNLDQIRLAEHLAVYSSLSLEEFCSGMRTRFGLPEFKFDCENETEWGLVKHEGVEYNVSRPDERGTLENWDGSVPVGCNFGIVLTMFRSLPEDYDPGLVSHIGQGLADLLRCRVYHHRTWFGPGKDVVRQHIFHPGS